MGKMKASIIGIAVFLVLIGAVSAVNATTVSVEPATQPVLSGNPFSVDINVSEVVYMAMDDVKLKFNPNAMQVTGVVEGDFLKSAGATIGFPLWNNTAGTVSFNYALLAQGVGVSGSGTLATINFNTNASAECTFDLNLTKVLLGNGDGNPITVDVVSNGTVKLDKTSPEVEILSPDEGAWFDSENVTITFHPWDNKDQELDYKIYDGEVKIREGTATNCTEKVVDLGPLLDCDHVITVNVTDDVGLTGSANVTIHVDRTPPRVEIISPANDTCFDSEPFNVTFHLWDNKAELLNYTVYVDGEEVANDTAENCTLTNVTLNPVVLGECDHVIRVNVTDGVGKTNSSQVVIHVDLTPPIMAILTPIEGKNYSSSCVKLNVSAEDSKSGIDNIWYSLDGGENVTLYDNGNASEIVYGDAIVSGLGPCGHSIVVYVNNTVGKVNSSIVNFTVYPGDIYPDKKVDGLDLQRLAWAYGSYPGDPNWNERADLNCDTTIDGLDLQRLAWNYGNDYNTICIMI